ncbi:hypothetical protein GWK48_08875 [Metallosphaera tengchongensis]|uniref:Uncharacterized protein n=1 Tax=Metallosphaera tengchongensis TaxID=1532350 RepID=A0A6N0NZG2_9CREN|nr:hypothetical protein [Metallosphaera tengchongensis]QKR00470.1 hypothetical protein GWK48_08875 [Metallosphaera tengchongensis]
MKLSFETLDKLKASGRYKTEERGDDVTLIYYPPSIEEASGVSAEVVRTMEVSLKKVNGEYQVLGGKIKENGQEVREISLEELELWIQFLEG